MHDADFRTLFESAPGLYLVLLADAPRYTVVAVSDAYVRATSTPRDRILGRGLFELLSDNAQGPHAGTAGAIGSSLARVVSTGAADTMAVQEYPLRRTPAQGEGPADAWCSVVHSPSFGAGGRLAYLLHHVQDMSAQMDMLHSQECWRELFAKASDGLVIVDAAGVCIDVNDVGSTLLGADRAALIGSRFAGPLDDAAATSEWTTRRSDGGPVPVEVDVRRLSDGRRLVLLRDLTQRRQREQAVEAARAAADELEHRVAERTRQLRGLAAQLEAAEIRERRQIARDLHDDLGQTLAAARIRLAGLCRHPRADVRKASAEVADLVAQANRSTRSLAAQLAPAVLYELGLGPALEWLAEEIGQRYGLAVEIVDDGAAKPLSQEARSIVYRAVRELLINVAKHADVRVATVRLACAEGNLVVSVTDAGVGFAPLAPRAEPHPGLGLLSVRERLSFIGGSFEIHSVPDAGTEATLRAPLASAAEA